VAIGDALDAARLRYGISPPPSEPWLDRDARCRGDRRRAKVDRGLGARRDPPRCAVASRFRRPPIRRAFRPEVAQMVIGAARMGAIRAAPTAPAWKSATLQAENLRKMRLRHGPGHPRGAGEARERTQALVS